MKIGAYHANKVIASIDTTVFGCVRHVTIRRIQTIARVVSLSCMMLVCCVHIVYIMRKRSMRRLIKVGRKK